VHIFIFFTVAYHHNKAIKYTKKFLLFPNSCKKNPTQGYFPSQQKYHLLLGMESGLQMPGMGKLALSPLGGDGGGWDWGGRGQQYLSPKSELLSFEPW
jgi:hypothetical protein